VTLGYESSGDRDAVLVRTELGIDELSDVAAAATTQEPVVSAAVGLRAECIATGARMTMDDPMLLECPEHAVHSHEINFSTESVVDGFRIRRYTCALKSCTNETTRACVAERLQIARRGMSHGKSE
jgi:hypothetical protein